MTNIERLDANIAYRSDEEIFDRQRVCRRILQRLNTTDRADFDTLRGITRELLGGADAFINPPFYCDYGSRIKVGKNVFINYNCTILDCAEVTIGDNCQLAPGVSLFTAGHPLHPVSRNSQYEYAKPIHIGDNVWLGGDTIVLPGVTIGSNTVIGAGSVVTHDIPAWSVAAGNPCRVLRRITEEDKPYFYKKERFDEEAWRDILAYEKSLLSPQKVAIVGYSGSGKSSLAQAFAEKYGSPLLHLDRVFWLPQWTERPRAESRRIIGSFLDQNDGWVIDGNYRHPEYHYARRMSEADRIIVLALPRAACLFQAFERWRRLRGQSRPSIGEGCPEKMDAEFVKWILRDGRTARKRAGYTALQKKYPGKVTVIRTPKELNAFYETEGLEYIPEQGTPQAGKSNI